MIPLAISKKIQNFSENLFIFSKKQKNFEDSEKTANFSCIPLQNCYIQSFQSEFIFLENPCTFLKQRKVWTLWEMLVLTVEFYCKVATASQFLQFQIFVRKTLFLFWKSLEFELFEDCYNFNRFYGKIAAFTILKYFSFSRKTEVFFDTSKSQNLNVLRNLTNSFALYSKFVTISDFRTFQGFFRKTHPFLQKNTTFERFEKFHCCVRIRHQIGWPFQSQSTSNWLNLAVFKNSSFFFEKTLYFFRTQFFE